MLFADNVVFTDEICDGVLKANLEVWRQILECKGYKLSRIRTK